LDGFQCAICLLLNTKISPAIACVGDETPTRGPHILRGTQLAMSLAPNKASYQLLFRRNWLGRHKRGASARENSSLTGPVATAQDDKVRSYYSCQGRDTTAVMILIVTVGAFSIVPVESGSIESS
jgi:hypothetical protein